LSILTFICGYSLGYFFVILGFLLVEHYQKNKIIKKINKENEDILVPIYITKKGEDSISELVIVPLHIDKKNDDL
jgi:hypothetical protein